MRGDVHVHSTASDGSASIEEMALKAAAEGLEYIAITDHSKALAMANGLDEHRVVALAARVRELNKSGLGIRVFSGIAIELPPRSVYLFTGSARKDWQHSIPAVKQQRWSITFRTLRRPPQP